MLAVAGNRRALEEGKLEEIHYRTSLPAEAGAEQQG